MDDDKLIQYGNTVKVDDKDRKIIAVLDLNARASIADISKKTGIQRDSVMYRIKRMEEQKIIRFYHAILNPSILGYEIYTFLNIALSNLSPQREKAFLSYIRGHNHIVYIAKTSGKWDYTLCVVAKNMKGFDELVTDLRQRFSDIIKDYDASTIIQEYKFDSMAGIV